MTLLGLSGLINLITSVSLAVVIWTIKPSDTTARSYARLDFAVGFYSLFYFLWQLLSPSSATLAFKGLFIGIILINQTYLTFVATITACRTPHDKTIRRISTILNIIFVVLLFQDQLYSKLEPRFNLGLWPVPTKIFIAYLVTWHVQCLYGFVQLIRAHRKKASVISPFIIVACAVGYVGGATNWPMWYGIHLPPYFNNLIAVYIGMIAYAVLHHGFMDIRLIIRDTTMHVLSAAILVTGCAVVMTPIVTVNPYLAVVTAVCSMALLMAFAYDPLRKGLQPAIDRLMFSNRFGYLEELAQLPNDMLEFTNLREMLKFLVTRLTEAGKLERVRVFMYDPGHQSYMETLVHEVSNSNQEAALELGENQALIRLLKSQSKLWTKEEMRQAGLETASEDLTQLHGAACFPVQREQELMGLVVLGPKRSGEAFNQKDLGILRALQMRLENFLAQAMVITQEALNLVKDSHDMKNDVNALKGRITWRSMRGTAWWIDFEKQMSILESWLTQNGSRLTAEDRAPLAQALETLKAQSTMWYQDGKKSFPIEEDAVRRMAHRLKNWAEYGRVISEGFRGHRNQEAIDVGAEAQLSVERWLPMAEKKNVQLVAETVPGLVIWGERTLLAQIIENLIDNALKATNQGAVRVICKTEGHFIHIDVHDSGSGIAPEALPTIFDRPFYQGRGRENLEQSTGVGLYLVAQYVRSLGGRVTAESQMGTGSTFSVILPAHQETKKGTGVAA